MSRERSTQEPSELEQPTRDDRRQRTSDLLDEARRCPDEARRKELLDEVVVLNLAIAEAVARRYARRGVPLADLRQAAYEGLVKAVHRFDPEVRPDLLTYAVPTIRGEVQRWFRDHSWMVRPPRGLQEAQWRISRSVEKLTQDLGRAPTRAEVGEDAGIPAPEVEEAMEAFGAMHPPSLDAPATRGGDMTMSDLLVAADSGHDAAEARVTLAPVVRELSDRDRRILYLRFFEQQSQSAIGDELGITQMQVSRQITRILRDLRRRVDADRAV